MHIDKNSVYDNANNITRICTNNIYKNSYYEFFSNIANVDIYQK